MFSRHVHTRDLDRLLRQEFRGTDAVLAEVLIELHLEQCHACRVSFDAMKARFQPAPFEVIAEEQFSRQFGAAAH